jgi:hypothetical protein
MQTLAARSAFAERSVTHCSEPIGTPKHLRGQEREISEDNNKAPQTTTLVFADAEAIKEQITENLANNHDDEKAFYSGSGIFQRIARTNAFVNVSLLMVAFSSIWIGVEVDSDESGITFRVIAHLFCFFFVAELFVRFMAINRKRDIFVNPRLRPQFGFDVFLVLLVLLDTWIVPALMVATNFRLDGNARFLLVFRLLRILRVLRVVRVVREIPELLLIIKGVIMAFRPIIIVLALVGLIVYAFAIVFRVFLDSTEIGAKRFASVPASMATLLIDVTLSGSRGGPIIRETYRESAVGAVILFFFVVVANITMMGVLGGLLVHTVRTVAEVEKEEHTVKDALARFDSLWQQFLKQHDEDNDGCISARELQDLCCKKNVKRILQQLQVDLDDFEDVCEFVLQENGGALTRSQLQKIILDLRSKNTAKVKDHVVTRRFFQSELQKFGNRVLPLCVRTGERVE